MGKGFRLSALAFALAHALEQRLQGLHLLGAQLLPTIRLFGRERSDIHADWGAYRSLSRQGTVIFQPQPALDEQHPLRE
eukprot:4364875-Alexandrium_andersonii.AAC.1